MQVRETKEPFRVKWKYRRRILLRATKPYIDFVQNHYHYCLASSWGIVGTRWVLQRQSKVSSHIFVDIEPCTAISRVIRMSLITVDVLSLLIQHVSKDRSQIVKPQEYGVPMDKASINALGWTNSPRGVLLHDAECWVELDSKFLPPVVCSVNHKCIDRSPYSGIYRVGIAYITFHKAQILDDSATAIRTANVAVVGKRIKPASSSDP